MLLLISCSDSLFNETHPLDANSDRDLTYQTVAKSIAKSLGDNRVQTILSKKVLLQEDGDFDILFSKLNDHIGYYSVSYYDPVPYIYDPTGKKLL